MTDHTPEMDPEMGPDEIEALRGRLAAPAPPPGVLDAARAAAMDAYDEAHADADAPGAPVRDIGSARPTPGARPWYQRIPLGAAAAILAIVALVGVATQVDLGSDDADSATADDSGDSDDNASFEESARESETLDESADGSDAPTQSESDAVAAPPDEAVRSAYDDVDALVDDFADRFGGDGTSGAAVPPTTAASVTDGGGAEASCDAVGAAGIDPSTVLRTEPVLLGLDGERLPAVALVYESEAAGARVAVVDEGSCTLLDDRAL